MKKEGFSENSKNKVMFCITKTGYISMTLMQLKGLLNGMFPKQKYEKC